MTIVLGGVAVLAASSALVSQTLRCADMSEDALIEVAVSEFISRPNMGYLRVPPQELEAVRLGYEPYESVEEFREVNPNCCVVSDVGLEGYRLSYFEQLRTSFQAFVLIDYVVKSDVGNGTEFFPGATVMSTVSSCGNVIDLF